VDKGILLRHNEIKTFIFQNITSVWIQSPSSKLISAYLSISISVTTVIRKCKFQKVSTTYCNNKKCGIKFMQ